MIECTSHFGDFDEKFSAHIVDIIKCHKKEFLTTCGIVIDCFHKNYDNEKDDNICSALSDL